MSLENKTCEPCRIDMPPLDRAEAEALMEQVPQWQLNEEATQIKRRYRFDNFVDALAFVNKVGELCESEGHHADISLGWGYAEVLFYTHKIKGLHENDFIMAAKSDTLYG